VERAAELAAGGHPQTKAAVEDWPAASCLRNTVTATPMGSARSSCDLGVDSS